MTRPPSPQPGSEVSFQEIANSDSFVFFGATGDLAYKQIFPALQQMIHTIHICSCHSVSHFEMCSFLHGSTFPRCLRYRLGLLAVDPKLGEKKWRLQTPRSVHTLFVRAEAIESFVRDDLSHRAQILGESLQESVEPLFDRVPDTSMQPFVERFAQREHLRRSHI